MTRIEHNEVGYSVSVDDDRVVLTSRVRCGDVEREHQTQAFTDRMTPDDARALGRLLITAARSIAGAVRQ